MNRIMYFKSIVLNYKKKKVLHMEIQILVISSNINTAHTATYDQVIKLNMTM